jgi:ribosomal-protein-alanine N-acetyltransferase
MIKDAADFYRIISEGNFPFFHTNIKSIAAEKRFLRQTRQAWKKKKAFNFSVLLSGKVIGAVGLVPEHDRPYNIEIGYFIDREYHGKGYALQATLQAEMFARIFWTDLRRLQAIIVVDNVPSIRVIEKAGFTREGCLQKYLRVGDQYYDAYMYGKIIR